VSLFSKIFEFRCDDTMCLIRIFAALVLERFAKPEDRMLKKKTKPSTLIASAAIVPWLLMVTALPSAAQPKEGNGDEVFGVNSVISLPGGQQLGSFDISFVDPASGLYLLADRTNKSIDVITTSTNQVTTQFKPGFVGATGNNDTSGPNGVLVANGNQVWVGDGNSLVWVLDLHTGTVLTKPISTALPGTTDPTRADELCHDAVNKIILMANDASSPSPFVTFISSSSFNVLGHIVMNGKNGTPNATGGIEQCQWSPRTGKFYLNVPNPASNPNDGLVLQIDPVSEKIEQTFSLAGSGCGGNNGMALGPFPQALLGCTNLGPNSVVINLNSGAIIKRLPGEAGADEVWYNPGDNQYFMGNGNHLTAVGGSPAPILGVVDATGKREDSSPTSAVGSHSVAADPVKNQVYVPINSNPAQGGKSGICGAHGGSNANGCIAVFTVTSGTDDKGKCFAQGAPVVAMNGGEPEHLKRDCD
jgi:hypothetical protein